MTMPDGPHDTTGGAAPQASVDPLQAERHPQRTQTLLHVGLLAVVCAALFLFRAASLPLTDPEEARCALVAREMLRSGDWVVPRLNGKVFLDKPAPFFWAAATVRALTGSEELGGRLVAALAALAAVWVAYAAGRRMFGATAGLLAGLVLATSAEFLFMARWYRMDMPFVSAMWAAIWWFGRAESARAGSPTPDRKRVWLGFYFFCALAVLFKGPAGLVLPVLVVTVYLLLSRQPRRVLELFHCPGIGLCLLIGAPWYVAISQRVPGYAYEFFVQQNLLRYTGGHRYGHTWPAFFYIPILLAGLLPWTVYLPGAVIRYFPRRWRDRAQHPDRLLLWVTAVVTLVFFSLSRAKLPGYILPAFPPLAVLTGGILAGWASSREPDAMMTLGARAMMAIVALASLVLVGLESWLGGIDAWIVVPVVAGTGSALAMARFLKRDQRPHVLASALAGAVVLLLFTVGHTAASGFERMSTRQLARLIPPDRTGSSKLCFWAETRYSLIVYADISDVEKFHEHRPASLKRLVRLMMSDRTVYCLVSGEERFRRLMEACPVPLTTLGQSRTRWLVTNHAPGAPHRLPAEVTSRRQPDQSTHHRRLNRRYRPKS